MNDLTTQTRLCTQDLVSAFLAGRTAATLRAYKQGLEDFAQFLKTHLNDAANYLISLPHGEANHLT